MKVSEYLGILLYEVPNVKDYYGKNGKEWMFPNIRTIAANSDGFLILRVITVSTVTKEGLRILRVITVVGNKEWRVPNTSGYYRKCGKK